MFLTIVTPFFNNLEDIKKSISLLEHQTCNDFELILINDASTTIFPKDLEQLQQNKLFDIQLINNEKNEGPGYSRNRGIQMARGDYLLFLDSDDWLDNHTVFLLKESVKQYKYDCIIFDYFMVKKRAMSKPSFLIEVPQGTVDRKAALLYSTGSVCCKVYRTQMLQMNNIEFPCIYIKEDMVFNKKALMHCEKIYYFKKSMYYYQIHPNSLMHSKRTFDVKNDVLAFKELEQAIKKYPEILEGLFAKELLYAGTLNMLCANETRKKIQQFWNYWISKYPNWYNNAYLKRLPFRMRVFLWGVKNTNWNLLNGMALLKLKL